MLILIIRNTGFSKVKQLKQQWEYLGIAKVAHLPFHLLIVLELDKCIFYWGKKGSNILLELTMCQAVL